MVKWICYPSGEEPDMWTVWHSQQNGEIKGRHATVMRFLTAGHWLKPHFKSLQGKHLKGLGEIVIGSGVQWRLFGHRDVAQDTFTLLVICNHKDGVYKPVNAFDTAIERWKEMQKGLDGIVLNDHPR
jgi:hypothetical protein